MLYFLRKPKKNKNYIITIAIGKKHIKDWKRYALPSWKYYCDRHDIGLVYYNKFLDNEKSQCFKTPTWHRLLIGKFLFLNFKSKIENVCFLDTDIIISPIAPNVFQNFDNKCVGLISVRKNLPESFDLITKKIAVFRKKFLDTSYPLKGILNYSLEELYKIHNLKTQKDEFCAGVFLFNLKRYNDFFYKIYFLYKKNTWSITRGGCQTHLNYHLQSSKKVRIQRLNYKFQAIWLYEMALKYPFLYLKKYKSDQKLIARCIESSLLENHFLHFAGSLFEGQMWKNNYFFDENFNLPFFKKMKNSIKNI